MVGWRQQQEAVRAVLDGSRRRADRCALQRWHRLWSSRCKESSVRRQSFRHTDDEEHHRKLGRPLETMRAMYQSRALRHSPRGPKAIAMPGRHHEPSRCPRLLGCQNPAELRRHRFSLAHQGRIREIVAKLPPILCAMRSSVGSILVGFRCQYNAHNRKLQLNAGRNENWQPWPASLRVRRLPLFDKRPLQTGNRNGAGVPAQWIAPGTK